MPSIFAPENLLIKKINGQKVRARDFSQYLAAYTNIFNGDTLPKPKTVLIATAEASNTILYNDLLHQYSGSMAKSIEIAGPYMNKNELVELHKRNKSQAVAQVWISFLYLKIVIVWNLVFL